MKSSISKLPLSQQGSFYSTIIIAAMFGVLLTAALKIAPAYLDNNVIVNTMGNIAANNDMEQMTLAEIRSSLMKTLNVNSVRLSGDAMKLVQEGEREFVEIRYETRIPLFFNISAVVSFNHRFEKN